VSLFIIKGLTPLPSVLKVINDGITETSREKPAPAGTPVVDLGLADEMKKPKMMKVGRELLLLIACLAAALALAVWLPKIFQNKPSARASIAPQPEQALEIDYEKVQADSKNIFRYKLLFTKDNKIIIHIDDIRNKTRAREEGYVEKELIQDLARFIQDAGFFTLEEEYQGVQPEILELWDMSVTIGKKTHKTKVVNRVEPEIFKNVREKIEVFGKNELGLWWEPYSAEQLVKMAHDSFLLAKKFYNEREIKYSNLAEAIKSLQKSEGDLKMIEPKPDFYPEILSSITDWKRELQDKYNDQNFLTTRSIRVKEWEEAAGQLRIICEMIPDRSDPRNQEARKKLLDVESRLNIKK